jgi:HK97 gp10 family phage protein
MAMTGRKAHIARLKRLSGGSMEREVGKALFAGGDRIRVTAQISITAGAVSGKFHVASSPGSAPNQDTGVLGNNIENVQVAPLLVEVSSNAPYSAALELGTSRMEARPFMAPARDQERDAVERLVVEAVKRVAKRGG